MMSSPKRKHLLNDTNLSFGQRASHLRTILFALATSTLAMPAAATSVDKMLPSTPLVLKDGRIAEVSVHTIPFPDDAVAPSSSIRKTLDTFTQNVATDCFLTAQVIGHVGKDEISGRETADIHRLARARADTIQSSLINNGLPAASIASVWDWRFMVKQARVTLWVFRLTAGEDCENSPLAKQAEDQVAAAPNLEPTETIAAPVAPKPAAVTKQQKAASEVRHQVVPAARPKTQEPTTPISTRLPQTQATSDRGDTQLASLNTGKVADKKEAAGPASHDALEIVFATNSSFFPEGTGDKLRAFMNALDKNKSYVLRIQTSVDNDAGVSGATSQDEAQRYNAWMAERRFKRVEAWLMKNSGGRNLKLEPSLIENDGSRRVRIEPAPLG